VSTSILAAVQFAFVALKMHSRQLRATPAERHLDTGYGVQKISAYCGWQARWHLLLPHPMRPKYL
jgi:hypothetical protein